MWLIVYSNDHAPLTVRPIYSSSKLRTAEMMIFSLVAMIGLEKCCITSACLQWLYHSGERTVARGPLVLVFLSCWKNFIRTQKRVQIIHGKRAISVWVTGVWKQILSPQVVLSADHSKVVLMSQLFFISSYFDALGRISFLTSLSWVTSFILLP